MPGFPRPTINFTPHLQTEVRESLYSLHPIPHSLLLSLDVSSSSFGLRLALLGDFRLGRCRDHCFNSRSLFLDDRDVSHGRILFTEELDAARVRQIGDADNAVQLEALDIDIEVARNIARQALDLTLAHNMLSEAALRLHAHRCPGHRNPHVAVHPLLHRITLQS